MMNQCRLMGSLTCLSSFVFASWQKDAKNEPKSVFGEVSKTHHAIQ